MSHGKKYFHIRILISGSNFELEFFFAVTGVEKGDL